MSEIYAPISNQDDVGTFVVVDKRNDGFVHLHPKFGGFNFSMSEEVFGDKFTIVTPERYADLADRYSPIMCAYDDGESGLPMLGYTNGELWNGWEKPLFTGDELLASTQYGLFSLNKRWSQIVVDQETGQMVFAWGSRDGLDDPFDPSPYRARLAAGEVVEIDHEEGTFVVQLLEPKTILVNGDAMVVYDTNDVGWTWTREPELSLVP